jgi:ribonuclease kappa
MKPVVGVMQAWSWCVDPPGCWNPTLTLNSIVMSVFAIVILSVIGALFKSNHHSMMGSTEDPKDGAAVAVTVFSAVIVYAVGLLESERL